MIAVSDIDKIVLKRTVINCSSHSQGGRMKK